MREVTVSMYVCSTSKTTDYVPVFLRTYPFVS